MGRLVKIKDYEIVPGTPGTAEIPGALAAPGTPPYYSSDTVTTTDCVPTLCSNNITISDPNNSLIGSSLGVSNYNTPQPCQKVMVCTTSTVRVSVYHPGTPGTPGTPGVPGVPGTITEVLEHLNKGWQSHSQSIDKLNVNQFIEFTVKQDVAGVLISLGIEGKDYHKINTFTHSILVEHGGVMVFENGIKVKTVSIVQNVSSVRLYRQPDNKVVCVVINGSETLVYEFSNSAHNLLSVPLSIYAHLYIADDAVETARFRVGKVHFGEA